MPAEPGLRLRPEDATRFDVLLEPGGSRGGNALLHVHPVADSHAIADLREETLRARAAGA